MIRKLFLSVVLLSRVCWASDVNADLHAYFQQACDSKGFIGTASLAVNSKTVFSDACGWADAEWSIANTDTRCRIGSIGKQFTAASVLLLHEEGRISLSDPIGKYLPDLPETWRSATIHQIKT